MKNMDMQPGISFCNIFLVKEGFERASKIPDSIKVNVEFEFNSFPVDGKYAAELKTILACVDGNDKNALNLEFVYIAIFDTIKGQENLEIEEFMHHNAPAIMFPYVREHIYNVTQRSGIKPILLPPVNISALIKYKAAEVEK